MKLSLSNTTVWDNDELVSRAYDDPDDPICLYKLLRH